MRKLCLLTMAFAFACNFCFGAIRRVGYNGVPKTGVDYSDFASAQTASSPGDTIQIYTSVSGTVNKRLVIMGFGYNLDANPNLQAVGGKTPSNISITFDTGSDSSVVEGCSGGLIIQTSNINIRRFNGNITLNNYYRLINNIKVENSVLGSCNMSGSSSHPCTNIVIYNCIFYNIFFNVNGSSGAIVNCVTPSPNYGGSTLSLSTAGFLVKNSIITSYNSANVNTVYENCFFGSSQPNPLPPGSNNRWAQSWANIFNRLGGATDYPAYPFNADFNENYYVLKTGSPAINAGFDASNNPTDAGIFGGEPAYRYHIGGVPAVPAIYKLTAPSSAATTNPYNVTISVRSNN